MKYEIGSLSNWNNLYFNNKKLSKNCDHRDDLPYNIYITC